MTIHKITVREKEAAEMIGVSVHTLRQWRSQGKYIPYVKLGRSVFYRIDDLKDFLSQNIVKVLDAFGQTVG